MTEILTDRLRLRAFTVADYEAAIAGDETLAVHLGVPVAERWMEFPEALDYWLEPVRADPALGPWALYGCFERLTGTMIGGGGLKGKPSAAGVVEIGYGLAPEYRGRGFATEMARALAAWAYAQPGVQLVIAHTLPDPNPSTRVLQRAGFQYVGEVVDPDDGVSRVWRWELAPLAAGKEGRGR